MTDHPHWYDVEALMIARGFTREDSPKARAGLQCRIVEAMKKAASRTDTTRMDWIERQVREYGNGHDEPREAGWAIQWQQQTPDDHWEGVRKWIDGEMDREVADWGGDLHPQTTEPRREPGSEGKRDA